MAENITRAEFSLSFVSRSHIYSSLQSGLQTEKATSYGREYDGRSGQLIVRTGTVLSPYYVSSGESLHLSGFHFLTNELGMQILPCIPISGDFEISLHMDVIYS